MMEEKWRESGVDVVNLILAAILFLTPWVFGFVSDHEAASHFDRGCAHFKRRADRRQGGGLTGRHTFISENRLPGGLARGRNRLNLRRTHHGYQGSHSVE